MDRISPRRHHAASCGVFLSSAPNYQATDRAPGSPSGGLLRRVVIVLTFLRHRILLGFLSNLQQVIMNPLDTIHARIFVIMTHQAIQPSRRDMAVIGDLLDWHSRDFQQIEGLGIQTRHEYKYAQLC